jgi:hypothetical protein
MLLHRNFVCQPLFSNFSIVNPTAIVSCSPEPSIIPVMKWERTKILIRTQGTGLLDFGLIPVARGGEHVTGTPQALSTTHLTVLQVVPQAFLTAEMNLFPGNSLLDGEALRNVRPAAGILDKFFCLPCFICLFLMAGQNIQQKFEEKVEDEKEKDVKKNSNHSQDPQNSGIS